MSSLTDRQTAPAARFSTKEMQAMFAENSGDFSFGEKGFNTRALAAQAGKGNGVDGSSSALLHNQEKEEEKNRNRISTAQMMASTSSNISQTAFDDLSNFIDDKMEGFNKELLEIRQQITRVKGEIVANNADLEVAQRDVQTTGIRAIRSADSLSIAEYDAVQKRELLEQQTKTLEEAREFGSPHEIREAEQALRGTVAEITIIEERIGRGQIDCDRTSGDHQAALERKAGYVAKRADLGRNLERLESDETNIKGRVAEYDSFKTFMQSPEIQAKLRNGTLTTEDLKAGGIPEDALARLKGHELTERNIGQKVYGEGYSGLIKETTVALKAEDKSYLDTAYETIESALDTISDTYDSITDGISNFWSSDKPETGSRVGTTAANADGKGIVAVPPTMQEHHRAAVASPAPQISTPEPVPQQPAPVLQANAI